MADSIPSLRRLVNELRAEIRELKARPADVVEKVVRELGPERVVDKPVIQYVDRVVDRVVDKPVIQYVDRVVDRVIEKPVIQYVDRVVEKVIYRDSPAPPEPPAKVVTNTVEVIKEIPIYQDNPDHIATIRKLQEKLCQFTSQ